MALWNETVLRRLLGVTTGRYQTGPELDLDLLAHVGERLHVAEAVAAAVAVESVLLPGNDSRMAAVLDKYGRSVPVAGAARGTVLLGPAGRLAMVAGRPGVIESCGPRLALITGPDWSRYTAAWLLPQVTYLGASDG